MKILALYLALIIFFTIATATQVNEQMGLYKINFTVPYDLRIEKTNQNEETYAGMKYTIYQMNLYDLAQGNFLADLFISDFDSSISLGYNETIAYPKMIYKNGGCTNINDYKRSIDGHPGVVIVGEGAPGSSTGYTWQYALDDHTRIGGNSNMPWDSGTLQLLKTIHVERVPSIKQVDSAKYPHPNVVMYPGLASSFGRH